MKKHKHAWQPLLENELVKLLPLQASHFEPLYAVASDPFIWEQHPIKDRYKKEVFQTFFDGALAAGTAYIIEDKQTNAIIGSTRFYDYKPEQKSIAIGYTFLSKAYWGGAYNSSIKKLMLDYAFRYVDKACFHIGVDNLRSQKAVEKLGAHQSGSLGFEHSGVMLPHFVYALLKQDWQKR